MRKLLALGVVVASLAAGCAATSPYLVSRKDLQIGAAPVDKAQVVFVRPTSFAKGISVTILDADGSYLGDSTPWSAYAVAIKPGPHTFIAWGEGTHAMKADLAAGKTYYVEVSPVIGMWSARFHLKAIKQSRPNWAELSDWLKKATPHEAHLEEGQRGIVDARKNDADSTIKKGVARLAEYTPEELEVRTLAPSDGS